jgi:hypothetical protein
MTQAEVQENLGGDLPYPDLKIAFFIYTFTGEPYL